MPNPYPNIYHFFNPQKHSYIPDVFIVADSNLFFNISFNDILGSRRIPAPAPQAGFRDPRTGNVCGQDQPYTLPFPPSARNSGGVSQPDLETIHQTLASSRQEPLAALYWRAVKGGIRCR